MSAQLKTRKICERITSLPLCDSTGAGCLPQPHTANGIEGGACNGAAEAGADSTMTVVTAITTASVTTKGPSSPRCHILVFVSDIAECPSGSPLDRLWAQVNQNSEMLRQLQRAQNVL